MELENSKSYNGDITFRQDYGRLKKKEMMNLSTLVDPFLGDPDFETWVFGGTQLCTDQEKDNSKPKHHLLCDTASLWNTENYWFIFLYGDNINIKLHEYTYPDQEIKRKIKSWIGGLIERWIDKHTKT